MTARSRVAVAGTGFGARVHVPALRAAGFEVVALIGRDREKTARRAARLGIPAACGSLAEVDADAVTIATPPHAHAPLVLEAVASGLHVLCEKPFARDAGEAAAMLDAAQAAGVVHLVGHEFRFAHDRAAARQAIRSGRIGRPRLAVFVHLLPLVADPATPAPPWWFDPHQGGGWLGASGSHLVDQVRDWLGEIAWVAASLPAVVDRPAEDSFAVLAGLEGGCVATLVQSAAAWGEPAGLARVAGDAGTVWLDGAGGAFRSGPQGDTQLAAEAPGPAHDDPRHRFTHLELAPYTRLCEQFRRAIEGGGTGDAATFADGLAVQRVLDTIRRSAAAGGDRVSVPRGGPGGEG